MLPFIIGVVVIVVGLAVSIGLHEIGHLLPAKLFGVKVTQYMIGFGPTIWSKRKGETEYGVKAIPLGGYISMIGMFPPAKGEQVHADSTGFFRGLVQDARDSSTESITAGDEHRAFYRLPVWKRIIIMLGGPFMNLVLAVVLFGVLLVGFGMPQSSTTVGTVNECVLPTASERQTCEPGDPAAPGAEAGVLPGDRIISIDGVPIESWLQSTEIIRAHPGDELPMVVERDGTEQTLTVTPALSQVEAITDDGTVQTDASGDPVIVEAGFVGIRAATERVAQPVTAVLPAVGDNIAGVAGIVANLPQRMVDVANAAFGPGERDPNGPMSVVGVGPGRGRDRGDRRDPGDRQGRGVHRHPRVAEHRALRLQPDPAAAARRRARRRRAVGGDPARVREALPPSRSRPRRPCEAHAPHARGRGGAGRHECAPHLRRHREADRPVLMPYSRGSRR